MGKSLGLGLVILMHIVALGKPNKYIRDSNLNHNAAADSGPCVTVGQQQCHTFLESQQSIIINFDH